jgi:redox-sensitive bicupin YhaK (pirin superfamily)
MITLRPSEARGHFDHGWLNTYHTFSFARYYDPAHMGFRSLRVINEDRVQGGGGFPAHNHSDMEIVTYVLAGALAHQDSLGTGSQIQAGDVQRMSAGTGISHAEANASAEKSVHFMQIWIEPDTKGLPPGYEQTHFSREDKTDQLKLIAAPARDISERTPGALTLHQDARIYASILTRGHALTHILNAGRSAWLQILWGDVALNEEYWLREGDGAAITGESRLHFLSRSGTEFLLFDLA